MNGIDKPFFKDPAEPKEDDLLIWFLIFYGAWEREFRAILGNIDFLISDENIKNKLMERMATVEKVKNHIKYIILEENKK